ncbi:MAG: arabinooligosaccharide transport system permease protein [Petroclostridium sp.]|jgi:multiple sugar transport system permease protein|uniref:carbohydrate ABC transporter permease n=1 Tax=Petroclostridium xylanilyticum TaxID=1792311 RepID=UPI000B981613|nr:sugar ABC transporter permease [Petroclostridium xylanilyticum]MBZ4646805.1 binding-protein-dependent transport system inner rane component [Clostridia bacterium]MDK2810683.1 arabinooligosaccharide transport system permease protein [Petroclostridium sp.]
MNTTAQDVVVKKVKLLPKKKLSKYTVHEERVAWLFILAPILQFLLFASIPMIYSFVASFTDWDGMSKMTFVGFSNYIEMFKDINFYKALFNTVFYLIGIPIGMILSLLLAMAMNRDIKGIRIFRTIYYVPVVSSLVAISIIWGWIYNGDYGLINSTLAMFGIQGPAWLFEPAFVKPAMIVMLVWKGLGSSLLLYLAGLQNIPADYYEACEIDGANAFQKFRHITLPLITPVSFYIVVTSIIGGLQIFTEIQVMTPNGGTDYSSASIVFYLFNKAFRSYQMGFASAVAWVLGVIIFIATIIQFKNSDRWVNNMN